MNEAIRTLSRGLDPPSSHAAAEGITRSGSRESMKSRVLKALHRWPGSTSKELAALMDVPHAPVHKRLPDLRGDGKARSIRFGSDAMVWYATKEK